MKRHKHSLSNYKLLSCNQGDIVPIGLTEVLPGDTFQHSTSAFIRVSPLVTPVMHPVHAKIHHFFVPHRLVWDDWEDFITGGGDGMNASVFPTTTFSSGAAVGQLPDYLGVKPGVSGAVVSALPFRGYQLIYNEYYRDQDLQNPIAISTASGNDSTTSRGLRRANWEKDYFTSARPWEQKGPSVSIPLTGDAPVSISSTGEAVQVDSADNPVGDRTWLAGASGAMFASNPFTNLGNIAFGSNSGLEGEADLSGISAVDMNDLRIAMALQRYEEARARYGSRYVEYLRYLGVRSSDARLQRPEYLGGGKQTIQFSEVLQTAPDVSEGSSSGGVAQMKGHGIGVLRSNRYRRFFEEHGYIFSLLIVRPIAVYADGLERHWNRRTKEDFWQMELQHVGQQAILNKEVYMSGTSADNNTFGFQDRYDEYRRASNTVAGEMRDLLDDWHMARLFSSTPTLNSTFVTANPTDRIYASPGTNQLYVMARHSIQARRKVSAIGNSYIF